MLWSGGYNLWTDVDTLFRGLEAAMARNPKVHFLSTGGAIDGTDTLIATYRYDGLGRRIQKLLGTDIVASTDEHEGD